MKSILKLILGLLLVLGINSCSKGDVASSGNSNLLSKLEIQKIGIQHNEALEYVLEGLKNSLSIINELETIQNLAQSQLSKEQAQVIIVGAEVGKMSVAYWSENFDEWQQVLSQGQGQSKNRAKTKRLLWFSWSDVAGTDVAVAVGTAVTVAIINVIPGAGQVAYGSAIVAGAAGGSVTSAVYQVWNHFF